MDAVRALDVAPGEGTGWRLAQLRRLSGDPDEQEGQAEEERRRRDVRDVLNAVLVALVGEGEGATAFPRDEERSPLTPLPPEGRPGGVEEEPALPVAPQLPSSRRSNLKRRLGVHQEDGASKKQKCISFHEVTVFYFSRTQGFTCVPSQGGSTLGMASQHSHVETFSISEHAAEQRRTHREMLLRQQQQQLLAKPEASASAAEVPCEETSSEESQSDENDSSDYSESEVDLDSYYFMQASGVRKIDPDEKNECHDIRSSRKYCGCFCKVFCDPTICICSRAGIKCQVDRLNFPCGCTSDGCDNVNGRVEFNPVRVRTHFIDTLMRLDLEKKRDYQQHWSGNEAVRSEGSRPSDDWGLLRDKGSPSSVTPSSAPCLAPVNSCQFYSQDKSFDSENSKGASVGLSANAFPPDEHLELADHHLALNNLRSLEALPSCYLGDSKLDGKDMFRFYPKEDTHSDNSEDFSDDSFDSQVPGTLFRPIVNQDVVRCCDVTQDSSFSYPLYNLPQRVPEEYERLKCYGSFSSPVANTCVGYSFDPALCFLDTRLSHVSAPSLANPVDTFAVDQQIELRSLTPEQNYTMLQSVNQCRSYTEIPMTYASCLNEEAPPSSPDLGIDRLVVEYQLSHEETKSPEEVTENFGEIIKKTMVETVSA